MTEAVVDYQMRVDLALPYDEAIARVTAALKTEGFGILTEIDVKSTLKKKINADFRRYVILGACNPPLAFRALSTELEIGLMLPCNVIVYETEDGAGSVVSIVDPEAMLGVGASAALSDVAAEAKARLQRVAMALAD
ncbi:MAG: DUF302 domain-containing protein [Anaerolineales bacterium]|nr:DUF302 domain-containing protein [Anaerolineales bacterium]